MRPRQTWQRDGICRLCELKHRGKDIFCRQCQRYLKHQLATWLNLQKIQRDVMAVNKVLLSVKERGR